MSDPEVPQNEQPHDVDHVLGSANEGLDAAAAARDNVPGAESAQNAVDADIEAFAAAERDFPGTFGAPAASADKSADEKTPDAADESADSANVGQDEGSAEQAAEPAAAAAGDQAAFYPAPAEDKSDDAKTEAFTAPTAFAAPTEQDAPTEAYAPDTAATAAYTPQADDAETVQYAPPSVADTAYAAGAASAASAAETQVVPAEPVAPTAPAAPQPIFVQAPEPPRELGNRGAAGGIGLVAALCFAILYLGAMLGFGALNGEVTLENIGTAALTAVQTFAFWVPVVVFFLAFWLLGAFINRARWGKWVTLGLFVAIASYFGHVLGQLFEAPFWQLTGTQVSDLVGEQLLAPLAIAAFVFGRELTIWFGAWVSRSGAKKKALNAEAQAEYERTLEAGPAAMRGA